MLDGKSIRQKLIGNEEERAVSPVIGVILMVAITVILAAVIAAFVLDMGQGQNANAQAGIQFSEDSGEVTVTVNSIERADSLTVDEGDCDDVTYESGSELGSVGETATVDCNNIDSGSSATIQVIGSYDGSENVVTTYDYDG